MINISELCRDMMELRKNEIGEGLDRLLNSDYNIERISNWAHDLFINEREEPSLEIDDILRNIFIMDAGPEFEYTEKKLRILAIKPQLLIAIRIILKKKFMIRWEERKLRYMTRTIEFMLYIDLPPIMSI